MAIVDGRIKCSTCREAKPLDGYQPAVQRRGCGQCRHCKFLAKRSRERSNPEKYNQKKREYRARKGPEYRREIRYRAKERRPWIERHYNLMNNYGLSLDEYNKMLDSQGGACAICGIKHNTDGKSLYVDHDHGTGRIRGLLCRKCNTGLGLLGDGIEGIERVMKYLNGGIQ